MSQQAQGDEAAVRAVYERQCEALIARRVDVLESLLADGFVATHIGGARQDKADWLNQIAGGQMQYHRVEDRSVVVELDGDAAVLRARSLVTATIWGSRGTWPLRVEMSLVRTADSWRIVSSRADLS
ncbi:nuclear transport factor 2 family protein [Demequina sp. NBRC 110056]|uniref:nuclear transport factor 2 family protein n=1 Tax=Demequina sp. NBRC 110056 TaxID=1570345 RepID=UPI000A02CDDA|nr:nuclear transport factor 2 family protein [Demequina sp. NBRC 110056]